MGYLKSSFTDLCKHIFTWQTNKSVKYVICGYHMSDVIRKWNHSLPTGNMWQVFSAHSTFHIENDFLVWLLVRYSCNLVVYWTDVLKITALDASDYLFHTDSSSASTSPYL